MGLRARLFLIVILGLGVSLAGSLAVSLRLVEQDLREDESQRLAAVLGALSLPLSSLMAAPNDAGATGFVDLEKLLPALGSNESLSSIRFIALLDDAGRVLSSTKGRAVAGRNLADGDPFVQRALAAGAVAHDAGGAGSADLAQRIIMPVAGPPTSAPTAFLLGALDEQQLQQKLAARQSHLVITAIVVSCFGVLILLMLLSIEVVIPLQNLVRMAQRVARGDLAARAPERGASELRRLSRACNDVAHALGATHERLETEVARRTEQLSQANERLERLALTDPLTGLFNRRYLDQALAFEVTRQRRHKRPFSVLVIDVDHFKHYNDTNGHPRGDEVLRQLARVVQSSLRASDIVARVGGEEFVVVLLDTEASVACAAAEKVRGALFAHDFPRGWAQPMGRLTVSIGLASWPVHGDSADEVLEAADRALYQSKSAGRNRVTVAAREPLRLAARP